MGVIILVVRLELVFVGGVMVSNVILYNMDEVVRMDVWVGDMVIVYCVGDVILKVVKVVLECRFDKIELVQLL